MNPPPGPFTAEGIERLHAREAERYAALRPRSAARAARSGAGLLDGVPLHWMLDWPTPFPMIVAAAEGNRLTDIDGNTVADFCLGDTGAMFGHVPPPIAQALADRRGRGLTHMLPSDDAEAVGALLASRFGLPHWQVAATASDANRFALRVARAVTGRRVVVVFDGCYHGAVDETLVDLVDGATVSRPSLLGPAFDAAATTRAVPFNDPEALARALAPGDVACVIAEPVMTNCSMILPRPGFHAELRDATRRHGTLLILDETHTISTGPGGYTGRHRLEPDILVAGKPVAGGVPASVWGFTDAVAARLAAVNAGRPPGHSGIGTTLSGSAFALAMLRACLESVATPEAYALMEARAAMIADGLTALIRRRGLPWHVARVGARLEVVFRAEPLADAAQARAAAAPALERTIHLGLLNRGYLATPFHNMLLVSPQTSDADAEGLVAAYDSLVGLLLGEGAP